MQLKKYPSSSQVTSSKLKVTPLITYKNYSHCIHLQFSIYHNALKVKVKAYLISQLACNKCQRALLPGDESKNIKLIQGIGFLSCLTLT